MSRVTRAEIARGFQAAKPFLNTARESHKRNYICFAIEDAAYWGKMRYGVREACEKIIRDHLGGQGTVPGWLMYVAGIPGKKLTHRALQMYRHRWLDHLIESYSK